MLRRHHRHIGCAAKIGQIKDPLMGFSVASDQPGPVYRQHHRQILQRHIMDDLVIASLQKGGINRKYRLHSAGCKSCRKCNAMAFRNPHVKKPVRKHTRKALQPRTVRHCRGNSCNLLII